MAVAPEADCDRCAIETVFHVLTRLLEASQEASGLCKSGTVLSSNVRCLHRGIDGSGWEIGSR